MNMFNKKTFFSVDFLHIFLNSFIFLFFQFTTSEIENLKLIIMRSFNWLKTIISNNMRNRYQHPLEMFVVSFE